MLQKTISEVESTFNMMNTCIAMCLTRKHPEISHARVSYGVDSELDKWRWPLQLLTTPIIHTH